jgi:hypothetical protein
MLKPAEKLLANRYEFKYLVDLEKVAAIREHVLRYLEPDSHTDGAQHLGYPVHSLYLDSSDLKTCFSTLQGMKNRFKLRIRFYDDEDHSPMYFEIKRRENKVILKQRAAVRRAAALELVDGRWPKRTDLITPDDTGQFEALINFCDLKRMIGAEPAAFTSYLREGYEPRNTNVCRVTFDREIRAGAFAGTLKVSDVKHWEMPHIVGVVLELKFNDRFPSWMAEMVEWYDLSRGPMPKYIKCVALIQAGKVNASLVS